jgi:hypothetical protein
MYWYSECVRAKSYVEVRATHQDSEEPLNQIPCPVTDQLSNNKAICEENEYSWEGWGIILVPSLMSVSVWEESAYVSWECICSSTLDVIGSNAPSVWEAFRSSSLSFQSLVLTRQLYLCIPLISSRFVFLIKQTRRGEKLCLNSSTFFFMCIMVYLTAVIPLATNTLPFPCPALLAHMYVCMYVCMYVRI